jgi:hypothetical protein
MAVFKGYYDSTNFSRAGEPLQLGDNFITLTCTKLPASPDGYVFLPHSSTAFGLYSSYPSMNGWPAYVAIDLRHWACSAEGSGYTCQSKPGVSGYYPFSTSSSGFRSFSPGIYTIAALDVWGDTAFLHFLAQ